MDAELIVDASVAAKVFFNEEKSDEARALLASGPVLAAPELIWLEVASVAVKRLARGLATRERAREAVAALGELIDEFVPLAGLAGQAFALAETSGCSAYDAAYLALARERGLKVLTADRRLVERAAAAGMAALVQAL